jgi:hypothetical protein
MPLTHTHESRENPNKVCGVGRAGWAFIDRGVVVSRAGDYSADAGEIPAKGRLNWLNWVVDESLRDWVGINIFSKHSQPTAPSMGVQGSRAVELFLEDVTDSGSNFVGQRKPPTHPREVASPLASGQFWLAPRCGF